MAKRSRLRKSTTRTSKFVDDDCADARRAVGTDRDVALRRPRGDRRRRKHGAAVDSIEVYDADTDVFTVVGMRRMSTRGRDTAATLLYDGTVFIAGGFDGTNLLGSSDVYDPCAKTVYAERRRWRTAAPDIRRRRCWTARCWSRAAQDRRASWRRVKFTIRRPNSIAAAANAMIAARQRHQAILLPHNNQVLIVGGTSGDAAVARAEVYVAWQGDGGSFFETNAPGVTTRAWAAGARIESAGGTRRFAPDRTTARVDRPEVAHRRTQQAPSRAWSCTGSRR